MVSVSRTDGPVFYKLVLAMAVSFGLWFVLSIMGVTRNAEASTAARMPAWAVLLNLALLPFFAPVGAILFKTLPSLRLVSLALLLISIVILEICFRRFLWLSVAALAVLAVELYWIIPKWRIKHLSYGQKQHTL